VRGARPGPLVAPEATGSRSGPQTRSKWARITTWFFSPAPILAQDTPQRLRSISTSLATVAELPAPVTSACRVRGYEAAIRFTD
jgi:hypothetical protein